MKQIYVFLIFVTCNCFLFAQNEKQKEALLKEVHNAQKLPQDNPEKYFRQTKDIEKDDQKIVTKLDELDALVRKCQDYKSKVDFESLKTTANTLFDKAKIYQYTDYQAIAKYYLFEVYLFNELDAKAHEQLEEGMKYIEKAQEEGHSVQNLKINFYTGYSNYFLQQKDYENQLKYIKLSGKTINRISDKESKLRLRSTYYSNLAQFYSRTEQTDSAKHYSKLSNNIISKGYSNDRTRFVNLSILGQVAMNQNDYKNAIDYFQKAEKISENINHINLLELYDDMIYCFDKVNQPDSVKLYQSKRNSLKLKISENQNNFLHNLLKEIDPPNYTYYIAAIALTLILFFVIFITRKKKVLISQELESQAYLKNSENAGDNHEKLIALIKENSPAFMTYFKESYPDFTTKLLEINPNISQTEMEFCALLKLKIPTKKIATYKFIAPKTVQNKKYLIRKKLKVPKSAETYHWFENL